MKIFQSAACILISAFCILLFVQPGIGVEKACKENLSAAGGITGIWKGKGVDSRGITWEFTFILTQKDTVIEGESSWVGSDGSSATSTMKGKIDSAKKTFTLKDMNLDNANGDVMLATYTGKFSDDFQKMTGKWTVPKGSPGTFEAVKEK